MKWEEVRKIYPDCFVKLIILESHIENDIQYVTEVALIDKISDDKATKELFDCENNELVYHTNNENIEITIRQIINPYRRYLYER